MTGTVPGTSADVAVTVTTPSTMPCTSPDPSTVATAVSLDDHVNPLTGTVNPFASQASAVKRSVSPADTLPGKGSTSIPFTNCATVTVALPDAAPALAVMVEVPLPTEVTSPAPSTLATPVLTLTQVTAAPSMTRPFWSRTSALSCTVSRSAVNSAAAGLTVIVAGTGGSGRGAGSVVLSPQPTAQAEAVRIPQAKMDLRRRLMSSLSKYGRRASSTVSP